MNGLFAQPYCRKVTDAYPANKIFMDRLVWML